MSHPPNDLVQTTCGDSYVYGVCQSTVTWIYGGQKLCGAPGIAQTSP